MSTFPTTSTTLLANLAERESGIDQAAWFRFFDLYQPVMVEFARLRGAGDDAEDVVQEVLANLAKTFQSGRYERAKGSFRAYLGKMLRNELINRFRRMQTRPQILDMPQAGRARSSASPECSEPRSQPPEVYAPLSSDDVSDWNLARHRAVVEHVLTKTAISEQSRRIYRRIMESGDNCAKVAREMGIADATVRQVKSRVSRMIAALARCVAW